MCCTPGEGLSGQVVGVRAMRRLRSVGLVAVGLLVGVGAASPVGSTPPFMRRVQQMEPQCVSAIASEGRGKSDDPAQQDGLLLPCQSVSRVALFDKEAHWRSR